MDKKILNSYSISFDVSGTEYGNYLQSVQLHKNVTGANSVVDTYIFDKRATDLLNMMLTNVTITVYMNRSGDSYHKIFSTKAIISKIHADDEHIFLYVETYPKINWLRKNGISIVAEHTTIKDAVAQFINAVDKFYNNITDDKKTIFEINYNNNVNKYSYECVLFPISDTNFGTLKSICKTYNIINSPFYIFIDDYAMGKGSPCSIQLYDLSDIKSLRAIMISDLNTSNTPVMSYTDTYYDTNVFFDIEKMQKINNELDSYANLKPTFKLDPSNRFKYNDVADTSADADARQQLSRTFFAKTPRFYKYKIQDIDLTKFQLGMRFVNDVSSTKSQYAEAVVEADIKLISVGKQNTVEKTETSQNEFISIVDFTTITN